MTLMSNGPDEQAVPIIYDGPSTFPVTGAENTSVASAWAQAMPRYYELADEWLKEAVVNRGLQVEVVDTTSAQTGIDLNSRRIKVHKKKNCAVTLTDAERAAHVWALVAADKAMRFRFLDLPAELRIFVYEQLLLFDTLTTDTPVKYNANILLANKQTHREGTKILNHENTFHISVDFRFATINNTMYYQERELAHTVKPWSNRRTEINTPLWPDFLRHVKKLKVCIPIRYQNFDRANKDQRLATASRILYGLCSSIKGSEHLRELDILFDTIMHIQTSEENQTLSPLQMLKKDVAITVQQDENTQVLRVLQSFKTGGPITVQPVSAPPPPPHQFVRTNTLMQDNELELC
jgi:hypothetical protein